MKSKVQTIRSEKNLSREALAEKARLPVSVVRKAEQGYELYSSQWAKIARGLGVHPSRIIVIQNSALVHRERG